MLEKLKEIVHNLLNEERKWLEEETGDKITCEEIFFAAFVFIGMIAFLWVSVSAVTYIIPIIFSLSINFFLWMIINIPLVIFVNDAIDECLCRGFEEKD